MRNETDSRNRFHRLGYTLRWHLKPYSVVAKRIVCETPAQVPKVPRVAQGLALQNPSQKQFLISCTNIGL